MGNKYFIYLIIVTFFIGCKSITTENDKSNHRIQLNTSELKAGIVTLVYENLNKGNVKVPEKISNEAMIVIDFQRVIQENKQYENVKISTVQFDCFGDCFPAVQILKNLEKKTYPFHVFNSKIIKTPGLYRIKLYIDDYFGSNKPINTDWIYFEIK